MTVQRVPGTPESCPVCHYRGLSIGNMGPWSVFHYPAEPGERAPRLFGLFRLGKDRPAQPPRLALTCVNCMYREERPVLPREVPA